MVDGVFVQFIAILWQSHATIFLPALCSNRHESTQGSWIFTDPANPLETPPVAYPLDPSYLQDPPHIKHDAVFKMRARRTTLSSKIKQCSKSVGYTPCPDQLKMINIWFHKIKETQKINIWFHKRLKNSENKYMISYT